TASPDSTLEVIGTASGRTLRAQDLLASSGVLVVRGVTTLQNQLKVIGPAGNNNGMLQQWQSNDGRTQGVMTSSGSLSESGRLIIRLPTSHAPETEAAPFSAYDTARFIGNNSGSFLDIVVQNAAT